MRAKTLPTPRTQILEDGGVMWAVVLNMDELRAAGVKRIVWHTDSDDPDEKLVEHSIKLSKIRDGRIHLGKADC